MTNTFEFKAIGTNWLINIYDVLEESALVSIKNQIATLTSEFEKLYSRFLQDSLVSKMNRGENLDSIPEDLSNMLNLAEQVRIVTDGHFNINIGTRLENLGYDSKYSFAENNFSKSNSIDLGGIGKGYLIDLVKELVLKNNIKYFFINAGGDIYATSNFNKPIEFVLQNPFKATEFIGVIGIVNKSIAASSALVRHWTSTNTKKELHHLIDYVTGEPITDIAGVFTLSDLAVNADLASTALFVSPLSLHSKIANALSSEYLIIFKDSSFKVSKNYPVLLN